MPISLTLPSSLRCGRYADILGFEDVDDVRNGMLLFKPLEVAFDHGQLYLSFANGSFTAHLLDRTIENTLIKDLTGVTFKTEVPMFICIHVSR
jgi:hypothetical protein